VAVLASLTILAAAPATPEGAMTAKLLVLSVLAVLAPAELEVPRGSLQPTRSPARLAAHDKKAAALESGGFESAAGPEEAAGLFG
jgi:hypothetical protein